MAASNQLDFAAMRLDCSGVVTRVAPSVDNGLKIGNRLCGLFRSHYTNHVQVDCKSMIPIPDGMDFMTAASLQLVFTTAYYSLVELARLLLGETVLIHCGGGGRRPSCHLAR